MQENFTIKDLEEFIQTRKGQTLKAEVSTSALRKGLSESQKEEVKRRRIKGIKKAVSTNRLH